MGGSDKPTLLVVEDERPLVEVYSRWLGEDYDVRFAESGSEALERLDEEVAVVLLDRVMPGLSGDEVLPEIRDRHPECRVAMVTALEPDFDIVTMGFDAYLTKPVKREELQTTVERLLARSTFVDLERELYSLAARRAALKTTKPDEELAASEEYSNLEERITRLRADLDQMLPDIAHDEFVAMVRDLEEEQIEGAEGTTDQGSAGRYRQGEEHVTERDGDV